ncbi:MAG: arsenate reductase/protein-tyrosine-phosphatase family protein [Promethearchaeota archaeon]
MKKKIKRILIICTGNTARSPVGEFLGNYYAEKNKINLIFDSAGFINAFSYIQPESQEYLDSKGINYSDFKPKIINRSLLEKQDLIITMETYHAEQIKNNFSSIKGIKDKTFTLKEFNGSKGDIIDPYYTNKSTYIKVMKELDTHVKKMVKKIIELNRNN